MNFYFENKIYLLLLVFVPFIIYFGIKKLKYIDEKKKKIIITLRTVVIVSLILALSGTSFYWNAKNTTTIFLLDNSQSVKSSQKDFEEFVNKAIKIKPSKDSVGVVAFGTKPYIETFVSKDGKFSKISNEVNNEYTNIEKAVQYAFSLFPNNTKKRVVLLSDGFENDGNVSNVVSSLKEAGVDLKVYKSKEKSSSDVAVDEIKVSEKVNLGETFDVNLKIKSTVNTKVKITLYSGNVIVGKEEVNVNKGENNFVFKDTAKEGGFKNYRASIEADVDEEIRNNEASAFTEVMAKPKVLVLEDKKEESDELVNILNSLQIPYKKMDASVAPKTIEELTAFKAVISCNVAVDNMAKEFLNSIDSYVKDFGGGYIAIGGDNSYALGSYMGTPLEKELPVNMEVKGKKEVPKMAMGLVIDRSGSMSDTIGGLSNLDLAKEGAIRSLKSLRNGKDEISVITFDDAFSKVVDRQIVKDENKIIEDIGSITLGGGTSIVPGLTESYESMKSSDAKVKHIILLTDGQAEKSGYDELIKNINENNITVSTVAVGQGADKILLKNIAERCGGRYYEVSQGTDIPQIFAKETFLAQKYYLNNREFTPVINSKGGVLTGVSENGLPTLLGYIGASPKSTANVHLKSDEDDPILTTWQYGLGKTVAWNSDLTGQWTKNYVGWNNFKTLWNNLINYSTNNFSEGGNYIESTKNGTDLNIAFRKESETNVENSKAKAIVVTPSKERIEIPLNPKSSKEYNGTVEAKETGVYMIQVVEEVDGKVNSTAIGGYSNPYSEEFSLDNKKDVTEYLISELNAKVITDENEVYKENKVAKKAKRELSDMFIIIALITFFLDIAFRRLDLYSYMEKFKKKMKVEKSNTVKNTDVKVEKIPNVEVENNLENDTELLSKKSKTKKDKQKKKTKIHDEKKILDTKSLLNKK